MEFWIWFWKIIFVLTILGFAGMAVWVTIGGWEDIRKLFASLDAAHQRDSE